ncbi:MAG: hypothetical protein AAGJ78_12700, partial [Pseudomonadota bacterium]
VAGSSPVRSATYLETQSSDWVLSFLVRSFPFIEDMAFLIRNPGRPPLISNLSRNAEVFSSLSDDFALRPTSPAKGLPVDRNPELSVPGRPSFI